MRETHLRLFLIWDMAISTQTLASSLGTRGANVGFNSLYQIGGPRSIQLALKLQF